MNSIASLATALGAFRQYVAQRAPRPWLHWTIQVTATITGIGSLLLGLSLAIFALYLKLQWGPHMVLREVRNTDPVIDTLLGQVPFHAIEALAAKIAMVMDGAEILLAALGLLSACNAILLIALVRSRARSHELQERALEFAGAVQSGLDTVASASAPAMPSAAEKPAAQT